MGNLYSALLGCKILAPALTPQAGGEPTLTVAVDASIVLGLDRTAAALPWTADVLYPLPLWLPADQRFIQASRWSSSCSLVIIFILLEITYYIITDETAVMSAFCFKISRGWTMG